MTRVIETVAGVAAGSPLAAALAERETALRLSQESHDAVLAPREPGGLSHALRAALAARMARHCGDACLAGHYEGLLAAAGPAPGLAAVAAGEAAPDPRVAAIVRHVDLVSRSPRDATRADIAALTGAGVSEPDVVRLSELVAFVGYQARAVAGLRLMGAGR